MLSNELIHELLAWNLEVGLQTNRIRSNSSVFEFDLKLFQTKSNLS
jgi:hypothetical protein